MATRNPVVAWVDDNTVKFTYTGLLLNDDGAPIGPNHMEFADRNVSVFGTFGAGGSVAIEGSNDGGTTYHTLNDQADVALAITAAKNDQILQDTEYTRPRVSAGDGTTTLTAVIVCRRQRPKR
jgi:hypothetical protein